MVKTRNKPSSNMPASVAHRRSLPVAMSSRASLLFMQIFGSQLGDGGGFGPIGSPTNRASCSDAYELDRRGLVGLLSPSSVRVDRPLEQAATGGCAAIYMGAFRNAKGVDMPATIQLAGIEMFGMRDDDLAREAARLQRLRHPNVLRFFGTVISPPGPIKLVMEHCRHGTLREELRSSGASVPLDRLLNWSRQLAAGMAHLEHHAIVHGDLRAHNVQMVSIDRCKIANFGLCRTAGSSTKSSRISFAWASPEAIKMQLVTHQSDVWSFGVTLWEIFSHGATPWKGLNGLEVLNQIDLPLKIRLARPKHCPTLVYSLISLCWRPSPHDRPTFNALESLWKESHPHRARVTAEYTARTGTEVTLSEGDVITLVHRVSGKYWYGQNQHGTYGEFPCDRVEQVFLDDRNVGVAKFPAGQGERKYGVTHHDDVVRRSSSCADLTGMDDISEPFEVNRHLSVPSGTCPKEAQRLLEKEFGMSSGRNSVFGGPIYDLTAPTELRAKPSSRQGAEDYEPVQRIPGMDTHLQADRSNQRSRMLRRCPSEPALMPTSKIYDDSGYMSMTGPFNPDAGRSNAANASGNTAADEYMYMKAGASTLSPAVTAASVATETMKKKSPTGGKKVSKLTGASPASGVGATSSTAAVSVPKLPPSSAATRKQNQTQSRPRANTLSHSTRTATKIEKWQQPSAVVTATKMDKWQQPSAAASSAGSGVAGVSSGGRLPAVLPKPKGPATNTTSSSSQPATLGKDRSGVGDSVQARIEKLRDRCNSDKPDRHAVSKRQGRHGTVTADRRSSSVDRLLTVGTESAATSITGGGHGSVRAAMKSFGAWDQPLHTTGPGRKQKVKTTHSRTYSASGSNASLGPPPSVHLPKVQRGRRSPQDLTVSPTSSGYSSSGD